MSRNRGGSDGSTPDGGTPARRPGDGSPVRPAGSVGDVHDQSAQALQSSRPGGSAAPTGGPPKAIEPGRPNTHTLADIRKARSGPSRGALGEEYSRTLWGGDKHRHFPVAENDDPDNPVTTPGGRNVDVPVDTPQGGVVAVEIKHYKDWKTVTLDDGTKQPVPAEVPLSSHIKQEIAKDLALRRADPGYDPRWVFTQAGPDAALRRDLIRVGIIFVEHG